MLHRHYLDTTTHQSFLNEQRIDPITGEKIEAGHTIVLCAACKAAFFEESWEYMNGKHCDQHETLTTLPQARNYLFKPKPIEVLPFGFLKGHYVLNSYVPKMLRDFGVTIAFLVTGLIIFVLGIYLALLTSSGYVTLLAVLGGLGIMSYLINTFYNRATPVQKIENPASSFALGIDYRKQGITFRRTSEKTIHFDSIREFNYYLEYHPEEELSRQLFYMLHLEILTIDGKKHKVYANIHRNSLDKWSGFLEQLPRHLPILNRLTI